MEAAELYKSKEALDKAQRIARLGNWSLNFLTHKWSSSRELSRILGYESDQAISSLNEFLGQSHPEDKAVIDAAIARVRAGEQSFELEHRMFRTDGLERVVVSHIDAVYGHSGDIIGDGVSHDVTELSLMREAEAAKQNWKSEPGPSRESECAEGNPCRPRTAFVHTSHRLKLGWDDSVKKKAR